MIAENNDKVSKGARCSNCRLELRGLQLSTNQGYQAVYLCANAQCPRFGLMTAQYLPSSFVPLPPEEVKPAVEEKSADEEIRAAAKVAPKKPVGRPFPSKVPADAVKGAEDKPE